MFVPANLKVLAVGLWPGMVVIMSETAMSTTTNVWVSCGSRGRLGLTRTSYYNHGLRGRLGFRQT